MNYRKCTPPTECASGATRRTTPARRQLMPQQRTSQPQNFDIDAPIIDFFIADGNRLDRAANLRQRHRSQSPRPRIRTRPLRKQPAQHRHHRRPIRRKICPNSRRLKPPRLRPRRARCEDRKLHAGTSRPRQHQPDARYPISPARRNRLHHPAGKRRLHDNQVPRKRTQAWADKAVYTPADRILVLTGSPRVSEGSMVTTASTIRINRVTDDAFADGDVKSTYSELTGATQRSAAGFRFANSRHFRHHDRAQFSRNRPVPRQRPSVAGCQHRRSPLDPV